MRNNNLQWRFIESRKEGLHSMPLKVYFFWVHLHVSILARTNINNINKKQNRKIDKNGNTICKKEGKLNWFYENLLLWGLGKLIIAQNIEREILCKPIYVASLANFQIVFLLLMHFHVEGTNTPSPLPLVLPSPFHFFITCLLLVLFALHIFPFSYIEVHFFFRYGWESHLATNRIVLKVFFALASLFRSLTFASVCVCVCTMRSVRSFDARLNSWYR